MNIQDLMGDALVFSVQDVDNIYEYVMFMNMVSKELSEQMETSKAEVYEHEDETGTYLIIDVVDAKEALNFIDLFIDATNDPELELDVDHLQLFTNYQFVFQRFINAKHQRTENIVANLFEDVILNDKRITEIDEISVFNNLSTMNKTVNVLAKGLESIGVQVIDQIQQCSKPTIH